MHEIFFKKISLAAKLDCQLNKCVWKEEKTSHKNILLREHKCKTGGIRNTVSYTLIMAYGIDWLTWDDRHIQVHLNVVHNTQHIQKETLSFVLMYLPNLVCSYYFQNNC